MSDKSIKRFFVSRFYNGYIMEADYSQLEVIVLAHLSGDEQLQRDILSGMDMHTVRASELFGVPASQVTKDQRTLAKRFSFQLQYGSGARNMAEKNGCSQQLAKEFIDNYYRRYKKVKEWQDKIAAEVQANRKMSARRTLKGLPAGRSQIQSETGRLYTFYESDAPEWFIKATSFKPTEMKNYPVQGTATGDIVPMMVGKVYRWLKTSEAGMHGVLINTVHDSIILDVEEEFCYDYSWELKKIMENAPKYYEKLFGVKFGLPLKVEITWGRNWEDQDNVLLEEK